jgi:quercetin dioxygenase-like cupin family protein
MRIRRVVTGHTDDGKAVVASDTEVEGVRPALLGGWEMHKLWGADAPPIYPDDGSRLEFRDWFPSVDGFRFIAASIPPETTEQAPIVDEAAATAEVEAFAQGMLATMEPDAPGMHTTDTVDLIYVVSGEVILELDAGAEVTLRAGDTIVQSSTRHAWRNRGTEECKLVAVQIGAYRVA